MLLHLAYHLHYGPASGHISACLYWLIVWVFDLVKNGSSLGFDTHSRQFVTVEFCQRGATVDTPFFTVLKTWTSPFEHSVIILVCVCLEFPKVLATRLASGSLGSTVLCLVLHQTLVFLLSRAGNGLLAIPTPHRPWLEATGHWFVAIGQMFGRPAR